MSVFLIFFLAVISLKIGQWTRNFGTFLKSIVLFYMRNIDTVSYTDLFTGSFRIFNTLIFSVLFLTQIGTKFRYVFKLHRYDLHSKISYRIQYILLRRALQEFECIYWSFLMIQIGMKFRYFFQLYRSDLRSKISHRI